MRITIFGATGSLGRECLEQALSAGHEVTILARTPSKLPAELRDRVSVVEGDALHPADVSKALSGGIEAVLFAIGVDGQSPEDLCTDITRHILACMPELGVRRFIWCGGGSTRVEDDEVTLGAKFVEAFGSIFMGLRHRDKTHQLELLNQNLSLQWVGLRPLQMRNGPRRDAYRLGFNAFSGFSQITFADCAHAMLAMLDDDTWLHKAPIIQY
jgi:putative NADH-flavin reductase